MLIVEKGLIAVHQSKEMFVVVHLLGLVGNLHQVQALPEIVKIGEQSSTKPI